MSLLPSTEDRIMYSAFSTTALSRESQVVGVDARPMRGRRTINDLRLAGERRQIEKAEYMPKRHGSWALYADETS
jgi:hypothetical protein